MSEQIHPDRSSPRRRRAALLGIALLTCSLALAGPASGQRRGRGARPAKGEKGIKKTGEIVRVQQATDQKAAADKAAKARADEKKAPKGPDLRRARSEEEEISSADLDDEIDILKELLEIERGSPTEADTLLELSYVLWDRAGHYEMDAYDEYYTVGIADAEQNGEKRGARLLKIEQQNLLEQARGTKEEVIDLLKRIERRFPRYEKLDEVLYSLGFHLTDLGRNSESVDAYMRLVRKVPNSGYRPDAYLGIANFYFGKNQGGDALRWYAKVLEFPKAQVYGWALYYIAWVHYNRQAYDKALKGFIKVLDYSANEANGRIAFFEDGSKYLVRTWSEIGEPKEALEFFSKILPGQELRLLEELAHHYAAVAQYAKSDVILDDVITLIGDRPEVVKYRLMLVDNNYKEPDIDGTVAAAGLLDKALIRYGDTAPLLDETANELAEIASTYHTESERTQSRRALTAAEDLYRIYMAHFPGHKHAYDMLHNHALALFQLERWEEAAERYERVITMNPDGKYAEPSAHRALISYLQMQDLNVNVSAKSEDTADLRPKDLGASEARIVRACERYVEVAQRIKKVDDVPEALFVAARTYYHNNHFDKAGKLFAAFLGPYRDHRLARDAARLMLSSWYLGQDGNKLIEWTDSLIVDDRFNTDAGVDTLGTTLRQIKENEDYNRCLSLRETPVKAAECLTTYARTWPDSKQAPRAYAGAARFYRDARDRDQVIKTYKEIADKYPDDERAPQAVFEIAEIYRETADYSRAADIYEDVVKRFPKSEQATRALGIATTIRNALAQYDKVIEDGELFLARAAKDDPKAVEVAYDVTEQYLKKGDWRGAVRASGLFLKKRDDLPEHYRMAAMVNQGTALMRMGNARKAQPYFDAVIATAKLLAEAGTLKDLPKVGRDAIAQALFMSGEMAFDQLRRVKGSPRNLDAAVKIATAKTKLGVVADQFYVEAADSKNPKWVAAAASRRGRIWHEIGDSIESLPPPPAFRRLEELRNEWQFKMTEKAAPFKKKAIEGYREALKKAAEIYAFDAYWAEARDNLKTLDPDFAALATIPERTVDVANVAWDEQGEPRKVVGELRYALFGRVGRGVEVGKEGSDTRVDFSVSDTFSRLARAHFALSEYREALVVARAGMLIDPMLRESGDLLNMLGLAEYKLGRIGQALQFWAEAAKADQKATVPLLNAASVAIKQLDFEGTVKLLDEVLARDPNNYDAQATRPIALRRMGEGETRVTNGRAAADALDLLVSRDGDRPEGHYNRCVVSQSVLTNGRADIERALRACEAAVAAVPKSSPLAKELKKRVEGLQGALEFMEPDQPDRPGAAAQPDQPGPAQGDGAAAKPDAASDASPAVQP